jgi:MOSC domain-containing protein YiiM
MSNSLQELFTTLPQIGRVDWIGIRPERKAPMIELEVVQAIAGKGLSGDRYKSNNGKRQVTLIQGEHLLAIASLLGKSFVTPELLRRNLVISGINLLALKDKSFRIGNCVLEYTGLCHPCSAMETTFGPGGYNAVRGHGGITARIIAGGEIKLQDAVLAIPKGVADR